MAGKQRRCGVSLMCSIMPGKHDSATRMIGQAEDQREDCSAEGGSDESRNEARKALSYVCNYWNHWPNRRGRRTHPARLRVTSSPKSLWFKKAWLALVLPQSLYLKSSARFRKISPRLVSRHPLWPGRSPRTSLRSCR